MLNILRSHPEVLEQYQQRFKYILVDEYQDTNQVQYLWLRLLAQTRKNICVVGDDDQSIYSWRGAEVANILRFEKDFPGAKVIKLEQNYRSTPDILAAASGLISANSERHGKTLWTERNGGDKLRVIGVWDAPEEARRVGEEIERLEREGASLEQCAILVRAQYQTREFEDRFIAIGLNYRIIGGFRFYERAEIRDALAYLRIIAQPADDLAFERIYNTPKRGLGDKTLEKMHRHARARGIPLAAAVVEIVDTDELPARARGTLLALMRDIARWRDLAATTSPAELVRTLLDESGYTAMLQAEKSAESAGRLENLSELARAMEEYETLGDFLEHVSLVMDNEAASDEEKVTIMTIHGAKGLEFDQLFLVGWEEGVFPSQRALDEGGLASLEEERRLAYVAITRAQEALHDPACRQPPHLWPVDQLDPLALHRRTASGAYRAGDHAVRRRIAVAGQLVRTRRSLCRCRPRPPRSRRIARPRLATRRSAGLRPRPSPHRRDHPQRRQLRRQAAQRHRCRRAGVPRQIRLWRGRGAGRQQAGDRFRKRGAQAGDRQLCAGGRVSCSELRLLLIADEGTPSAWSQSRVIGLAMPRFRIEFAMSVMCSMLASSDQML